MTLLLLRAQNCWATDVSIQVFCTQYPPLWYFAPSTLLHHQPWFQHFLNLRISLCTAWHFSPGTVLSPAPGCSFCNPLLSKCSTACNTPAVVFRANRPIMRSLLDLRQVVCAKVHYCTFSNMEVHKIYYTQTQGLTEISIIRFLFAQHSTKEALRRLLHLFQIFCQPS